ncbi:acVLRF1 family peptidyl-tRNA hydrolase [Nonomuraea sp. NPDC050310]|uniref:acVLRF1 family peptidyl-tRNA hydrolase n=1 Tax=unclassified Nonomuraea TaxID=2593643 RepID=UPI0033F8DABD
MTARPAKGGGRWVDVAPERLNKWIDGFAGRHGPIDTAYEPDPAPGLLRLVAADGSLAELTVPFPPFDAAPPYLSRFVAHAQRARTVGVILARLGGHAAGVFRGTELIASKVGSTYVQGRTAAGGWSQQRFARRRGNQAGKAAESAAGTAARVLLPHEGEIEAVILGGERRAVEALSADPRLAGLLAKAAEPFLTVPDPRLAVLRETPALFRAVRVRVINAGEAVGEGP